MDWKTVSLVVSTAVGATAASAQTPEQPNLLGGDITRQLVKFAKATEPSLVRPGNSAHVTPSKDVNGRPIFRAEIGNNEIGKLVVTAACIDGGVVVTRLKQEPANANGLSLGVVDRVTVTPTAIRSSGTDVRLMQLATNVNQTCHPQTP